MTQVRNEAGRVDAPRPRRRSPAITPSPVCQQFSVIHPKELGASEIARWRAFQNADPDLTNPFLSPEFTVAVGRVREQARIAVLSDSTGPVGFLPFERRRFGVAGPIAGAINGCQGLVHAPGLDWDPQTLLSACGLLAWTFDHLASGQTALDDYRRTLAPSPVMDLTDGYDAYLAALKARPVDPTAPRVSWKELAGKERKLGRDLGPVCFDLDSRDVTTLHTLIDWKTAHYAHTGATDNFARRWVVELLELLLDTRTDHFCGVLSQLRAGDQVVAAQFGLRCGGVLAGWHMRYNTDLPRYSPGLLQLLNLARAAAAAGVHTVDMGRGAAPYKSMFSTRQPFVAQGEVVRTSPAAAAHRLRYMAEPGLREFVSGRPRLLRAAEWTRGHGTRVDSAVRRRWQAASGRIGSTSDHGGAP